MVNECVAFLIPNAAALFLVSECNVFKEFEGFLTDDSKVLIVYMVAKLNRLVAF